MTLRAPSARIVGQWAILKFVETRYDSGGERRVGPSFA